MNEEVLVKLSEIVDLAKEVMNLLANQAPANCGLHTKSQDVPLPEVLRTPQAEALHAKLRTAGILDANWQPTGLTNNLKGMLAMQLAQTLDINNQWKVFGELWGLKTGTLRSAYNKAMEQTKTLDFQDRLNEILHSDS